MLTYIPVSKFPLGQLVATATAVASIPEEEIAEALCRHALGDWGGLDDDDKTANEEALQTGKRLMSAYTSSTGVRFWIITEWDRSATTVLLPEDY
jgi:hypothetical protein